MRHVHFGAVAFLVLELLAGFILLFHACGHSEDYWSILILVPITIAFLTPPVCYGYNREDDVFANSSTLSEETFRSCKELGWAVSLMLLMGAYGIPVLAYWNAHLSWWGVVEVQSALSCWVWAHVIWLRIFVFY
jgi:hypothetical protein